MLHQGRQVLLSIVRDVTSRKQIESELSRYRANLEKMVDQRTEQLKATQKELGDMIGATRESINKELKILREKELIKIEGNRIQILDLNRLKRKFR